MYAEKLLPHNIEAEEGIVGSLLLDGEAILKVAHQLKPNDFYREKNRHCYQACLNLLQRGEAINQITVAHELDLEGHLEPVGGAAYLSHTISIVPTPLHIEHYALIVSRTATMRRLVDAAANISSIGYDDASDVEEAIRRSEEILFQVREGHVTRDFVPIREVFDQYLEERAAPIQSLTSKTAVMTSFDDLDQLLGGLQPSDLVILAARPSLGKSALAINITINAAKRNSTVGIFSLEMSREQLALRMLASEARVDAHRLRLGLYTEAEEHRVIDAVGSLSELPVYVDDSPLQGIVEMRSKARRLFLEHSLDMLVVDYLQLVQGLGRSENRVQAITNITQSLKGLARDLNIPVLTVSQLSRAIEQRPSHRPLLSDLRDSGSIEQDADVVMFIHREDMYTTEEEWERRSPDRPYPKNIAEIIVAKHRHGPTGNIKLIFRDTLVSFEPAPLENGAFQA